MIDSLGRYYTNDKVSNLLINSLHTKSPKLILDLGLGNASLSLAAFKRWQRAEFHATEIEIGKVEKLSENYTFLNIYHCDTLKPSLIGEITLKYGSIDVAICNPPYLRIADHLIYDQLFKDADCADFAMLNEITSEIVFFAHNMALLKDKGELGIIVSDSLLTGKRYEIFRKVILDNFHLKSVIQLPDNIFKKTEARTHILIISKEKSSKKTVNLYGVNSNGELMEAVICSKANLVFRMDHKFNSTPDFLIRNHKTLFQLDAKITRGRYTHKFLKYSGVSYLHSNNILNECNFDHSVFGDSYPEGAFARKGDIVICRVGKRCLGRVAQVTVNRVLISDCICKITVDKKYQNKVFKALKSEYGIKWLNKYAHGVCAQVISKSDLMNFPVKL